MALINYNNTNTMPINYHYDDISFSGIRSDLESYSWEKFRRDLSAGFAVAFITVPQAMAYALVAGLPLSCGVFAAVFSAIVASTFGSSRHLVIGPNNALAILVQAATSEILFTYYRDVDGIARDTLAIQVLTQLVLLVGLFQVLAAVCKLGRLTQFVSHSVIIGYIAGVALAVVITQLQNFLGLPSLQGIYSLYERGAYIITHANLIHIPTAIVGISSLITLIAMKRTNRKLPAALIVLAGTGILVHLLGLSSYTTTSSFNFYHNESIGTVPLVGDTSEIYGIIPTISLPYFDTGMMNHLVPFAFAIALLSILETTSVAKSIAASSGQRLSVNQEIFGLGLSNLAASLIGALPSSGSPSRSSLAYTSGAQTRFAAIFNALFTFAFLLIFGYFVNRIPLTALSAILLVNSVNIVNGKQFLLCLKATSSDAFVLFITLLSCMFFSLHIAFYIGVVLSIILYLKKAAVPHLVECTFDDSGKLENINFAKNKEPNQIRIINVQGELFFGAADLFQTTLKTLAEDDNRTKVIILRLKNARDIDATACLALQQLYEYLKSSGRYLICCGLTEQSWEVLSDSGIVDLIGKENLFIFDEQHPYLTVQKALNRAKALIGLPKQTQSFPIGNKLIAAETDPRSPEYRVTESQTS